MWFSEEWQIHLLFYITLDRLSSFLQDRLINWLILDNDNAFLLSLSYCNRGPWFFCLVQTLPPPFVSVPHLLARSYPRTRDLYPVLPSYWQWELATLDLLNKFFACRGRDSKTLRNAWTTVHEAYRTNVLAFPKIHVDMDWCVLFWF